MFLGNYYDTKKRQVNSQPVTLQNGTKIEVYQPAKRALKTVLLIYGFSALGETDPRMIRFARNLTASGLRVVIPVFPQLKSFKLDVTEIESARECLRYVLKEYSEPLCVIAFSAGGSMTLRLSGESEFSRSIQLLMLFSPVYDWRETLKRIYAQEVTQEKINQDPDNLIWIQFVIAYRSWQEIGLSEIEKETLQHYLSRYSIGLSLPEKILFYNQSIQPRLAAQNIPFAEDNPVFDAFSPREKLQSIQARVLIVHDANDPVVLPSQSSAIAKGLAMRNPLNHRLLITSALSHVTIKSVRRWTDIIQMIDMIGELYS